MISMRGDVTGETIDGAWVNFESPSTACQNCSCASMYGTKARGGNREVWLPLARQPGKSVELSLSTVDSLQLLVHSILFPLTGFVSGALGAQALGAAEPLIILGSVLGLGCGILFCKKQSLNRFQINRGNNDSF